MLRASSTPGMACTRFNRSSRSMVALTILCRGSECRRAPVRAGLRVPRFPRRPPGTCCPSEDPDLSADNLDSEDLVTTGNGLPRREGKYLAAGSPHYQVFAVLIPISRHYSLH